MIRYEVSPPGVDGAAYQRWLRGVIARLERQQAVRIETVADLKEKLDETIERAEREIRNLKAQISIGSVQ